MLSSLPAQIASGSAVSLAVRSSAIPLVLVVSQPQRASTGTRCAGFRNQPAGLYRLAEKTSEHPSTSIAKTPIV